MTLVALLLALAGWVALMLAMDRHSRDLLGRTPSRGRVRRLRIGATGAMVGCYGAAVAAWGAILGSIMAYALLSLAAALVLLAVSQQTARKDRR